MDMHNLSASWKPGQEHLAYKITPETIKDGRTTYSRKSNPSTPRPRSQVSFVDLTQEEIPINPRTPSATVTLADMSASLGQNVIFQSPEHTTTGNSLNIQSL